MSQQLRILYLANAQSIHTQRWVGWFAKRHDVRLLSSPPFASGVWGCPDIQLAEGSIRKILPRVDSLRTLHYLKSTIRDFRPNIVHAHFLAPNAWIAAASGFKPFVTTTWGSDMLQVSVLYTILNRWAIHRANLNTADSQEMVDRLITLGVQTDKAALIQHGVDTDIFKPGNAGDRLRNKLNIPDNAIIIFSPRALSSIYNIPTIIQSVADLVKDFPNLHLVLLRFNADQTTESEILTIAKKTGFSERLHMLNGLPHADMPGAYQMSSVVVSVPNSDTTPVSLLEAMACQTSIIATDLPSIREWIQPNISGWLVPPKDVAALRQALKTALLQPPNMKEVMVARNRQQVITRASLDVHMTKMETCYRQLLAQSPLLS